MIYECPNCHVPQAAGRTSCHHCGAEFDSPVPADALVPESSSVHAATDPVAVPSDAMPQAPLLEEVRVPQSPNQPAEMPVYQSPPAYQPSAGYLPPAYTPPAPAATGFKLPKALLIAIPIVLVLVLGAVFFANSLNQSTDSAAAPTATPEVMAPIAAPPAAEPQGSPLVLSGGTNSATNTTDSNPNIAWLVGRWQNKSTDYYVFNDNGTGYRGSSGGKQAKGSFLWVLEQKQLVLYADTATPEKLAFSQGSDDNSMYLRGNDGRYMQFAREKTSP